MKPDESSNYSELTGFGLKGEPCDPDGRRQVTDTVPKPNQLGLRAALGAAWHPYHAKKTCRRATQAQAVTARRPRERRAIQRRSGSPRPPGAGAARALTQTGLATKSTKSTKRRRSSAARGGHRIHGRIASSAGFSRRAALPHQERPANHAKKRETCRRLRVGPTSGVSPFPDRQSPILVTADGLTRMV